MKSRGFAQRFVSLAMAALFAVLVSGCGGYRSIFVASVSGDVTVSREGKPARLPATKA